MSLGGIIGKLIGGAIGGGLFGDGEKKQSVQATPRPAISTATAPAQQKKAKAGRLALIKTKRTGVFDEESTSGRGKLFGN